MLARIVGLTEGIIRGCDVDMPVFGEHRPFAGDISSDANFGLKCQASTRRIRFRIEVIYSRLGRVGGVGTIDEDGTVANPDTVPQALMHNLKHNQVLHERNVILTVIFHEEPWVPFDQRVRVTPLAQGFWRVEVHYGFKNAPDIPQALSLCAAQGLEINLFEVSYFLSREIIVPTPGPGMGLWREKLFALMSRNAGNAADFFHLPGNCVIELGTRVQI